LKVYASWCFVSWGCGISASSPEAVGTWTSSKVTISEEAAEGRLAFLFFEAAALVPKREVIEERTPPEGKSSPEIVCGFYHGSAVC
jgi:hypothetical protein